MEPHIYDLSVSPPLELAIQDQFPVDFGLEPQTSAEVLTSPANVNVLQWIFTIQPACPAHVTQEYSWMEDRFLPSTLHYELNPVRDLGAYCEEVLNQASRGWGPDEAIVIANSMLEIWPPDKGKEFREKSTLRGFSAKVNMHSQS